MNEKMPINVNKEKVNSSVFSEHFPGSEIKEITANEIPENVMKYFESKSAQFILPDDYKPGNFEKFFIILKLPLQGEICSVSVIGRD